MRASRSALALAFASFLVSGCQAGLPGQAVPETGTMLSTLHGGAASPCSVDNIVPVSGTACPGSPAWQPLTRKLAKASARAERLARILAPRGETVHRVHLSAMGGRRQV